MFYHLSLVNELLQQCVQQNKLKHHMITTSAIIMRFFALLSASIRPYHGRLFNQLCASFLLVREERRVAVLTKAEKLFSRSRINCEPQLPVYDYFFLCSRQFFPPSHFGFT